MSSISHHFASVATPLDTPSSLGSSKNRWPFHAPLGCPFPYLFAPAPSYYVFYGEQLAADEHDQSTDTWILISYAADELGIQFLVGVETEFTLLKSTNPIVPVNDHQWSTTVALTTGTVESRVLEEIADGIQADGIELQMYHSEGAPGQVRLSNLVHVGSEPISVSVRNCHWSHVTTRDRGRAGPHSRDHLQHRE